MGKKPLIGKYLAVGIILLFIGVAIAPSRKKYRYVHNMIVRFTKT